MMVIQQQFAWLVPVDWLNVWLSSEWEFCGKLHGIFALYSWLLLLLFPWVGSLSLAQRKKSVAAAGRSSLLCCLWFFCSKTENENENEAHPLSSHWTVKGTTWERTIAFLGQQQALKCAILWTNHSRGWQQQSVISVVSLFSVGFWNMTGWTAVLALQSVVFAKCSNWASWTNSAIELLILKSQLKMTASRTDTKRRLTCDTLLFCST